MSEGFTVGQVIEGKKQGYGIKYNPKQVKKEFEELLKKRYKSEHAAAMLARKYFKSPSRIYAIMALA